MHHGVQSIATLALEAGIKSGRVKIKDEEK